MTTDSRTYWLLVSIVQRLNARGWHYPGCDVHPRLRTTYNGPGSHGDEQPEYTDPGPCSCGAAGLVDRTNALLDELRPGKQLELGIKLTMKRKGDRNMTENEQRLQNLTREIARVIDERMNFKLWPGAVNSDGKNALRTSLIEIGENPDLGTHMKIVDVRLVLQEALDTLVSFGMQPHPVIQELDEMLKVVDDLRKCYY